MVGSVRRNRTASGRVMPLIIPETTVTFLSVLKNPAMASRALLLRTLGGAGVGAGLVVLWWVVFSVAPGLFFTLVNLDCRGSSGLSCALGTAFISIIVGVTLVVTISVLLGWLVLRAVGIHPAWPVALIGPPLAWVLSLLADPVLHAMFGQSAGRLIPPFALGYGLAALLTTRRGT